MQAIDRIPELTFGMYHVNSTGIKLAVNAVQAFFGKENYEYYRTAAKKGEQIPAEVDLRVDQEVYARVKAFYPNTSDSRDGRMLYETAIMYADRTEAYSRGVMFADQDRQATSTNNLLWQESRPSVALKILTMPTRLIGQQYKYEQGRQLGDALLCSEVMSRDENGRSRAILSRVNDFLEEHMFVGKKRRS